MREFLSLPMGNHVKSNGINVRGLEFERFGMDLGVTSLFDEYVKEMRVGLVVV